MTGTALMSTETPARASDTSGPVEYVTGPWQFPDRSHFTEDLAESATAAAEMTDFNKGDFAGSYVDRTSTVVVVAATPTGYEMASKQFAGNRQVRVEMGALSLARATELGLGLKRNLPGVGEGLFQWALDPASSRLKLGFDRSLSEEMRADIDRFALANGIQAIAYVDEGVPRGSADDRQEDASPFAGGFSYRRANGTQTTASVLGRCSGGFGYQNNAGTIEYILTAGHCWDRGSPYDVMWNTYSSGVKKNYIGLLSYSTWNDGDGTVNTGSDNGNHGDLALVSVSVAGKSAGKQIWWGSTTTTSKIPVTARVAPTVNTAVCINGIISGSDCGLTIVEANINHTYDNGETVINGDYANSTSSADCSQPGDSGGSIVVNHSGEETEATAVGIISGHITYSIGCAQVFTGVEEAMQAWSGGLRFQ